jgi:hypothetical protein
MCSVTPMETSSMRPPQTWRSETASFWRAYALCGDHGKSLPVLTQIAKNPESTA